MSKKLITERDVLQQVKAGAKSLVADDDTILTPSARDAAIHYGLQVKSSSVDDIPPTHAVKGISYVSPKSATPKANDVVIAIGSDHGGFRLKEALKQYVADMGYTVADVGTNSEESCDYPDFAYAVATLVASGKAAKGIMIDGVGVASAIVANKVPGIRAVPCYDEFVAKSSREHNDANILTLGGRVLGLELAESIVKTWLETWFGGGRHQSRVQKIADIERRFANPR